MVNKPGYWTGGGRKKQDHLDFEERPAFGGKTRYAFITWKKNLRRRFGVSVELYERLYTAQQGLCAICNCATSDGRILSVDHEHTSGMIRGLLCSNCNHLLGKAKDDPAVLLKAVAYLQNTSLIVPDLPEAIQPHVYNAREVSKQRVDELLKDLC